MTIYKSDRTRFTRATGGILFFLLMVLLCALVYKADIQGMLRKPVKCTLYILHKEDSFLELNDQNPDITEDFLCTVPDLKQIRLKIQSSDIASETNLDITLVNKDTGSVYFDSSVPSESLRQDYVVLSREDAACDSENAHLRLSLSLVPEKDSSKNSVIMFCSWLPGIAEAFNGNADNHRNLIYDMLYGSGDGLRILYLILCVALILLGSCGYYLLILKEKQLYQAYVPLALILGIIMLFVIPIHAVPDEATHIDEAYRLSNMILQSGSPEASGYIYKRRCDAVMEDMLANTLESNHYYQLHNHFFRDPDIVGKDLITAGYRYVNHIVPVITYVPGALGITLGRLFGLSALMTFTLGRIMNLFLSLLCSYAALRILPYGRNVMALIMLLPISVQQAASMSYDSIVCGILFVFLSIAVRCINTGRHNIVDTVLLIAGSVWICITKGGVYLPLVLLLLPVFFHRSQTADTANTLKTNRSKIIILCTFSATILAVLFVIKFYPVFKPVLEGSINAYSGESYSIPFLLAHPFKVLYLYWNTFQTQGGLYLHDLFGGVLAWREAQINILYTTILLIGLLLLANTDGDRLSDGKRTKVSFFMISAVVIILVLLSMLVMYTSKTDSRILGSQGRYFLPVLPLLAFSSANSMVYVKQGQARRISLLMILSIILMILNEICLVMK